MPACMLIAVSRLIKIAALLALVVYGLASMHCILEGVPGFDFLKTCCFMDTKPSGPHECDSDDCVVESGKYRTEEQTLSAPQPLLFLVFLSSVIEAPLFEPQVALFVASDSPPELPRAWQFSHRTALPPRAPSIIS